MIELLENLEPAMLVRFWRHVLKTERCWIWTGNRNSKGYGQFYIPGPFRAHRFSFIIANGPIPPGKCVLHRCDNPPCVNPEHLFLGTQIENLEDMRNKGRARQGHTYAEQHHGVTLTREQCSAIRCLIGRLTQKQIAERFHTSQCVVWSIKNGTHWSQHDRNPRTIVA